MSRRSRTCWLVVASLVVVVVLVGVIVREHIAGLPPRYLDAVNTELYLSADPPQGHWGEPDVGARWEEDRRQSGIALARREECGPVRCALRVIPGAAARKEPELEVELNNASDEPVLLQIHRDLLDVVTFILRDADNAVVSSFCYITVHSSFRSKPPIILGPGESKTTQVYLAVAADHGFQALPPGLYSLEAVFVQPLMQPVMLARSGCLPVRVGGLSRR